MSSENPSVGSCSLISERWLNEAWDTLGRFSEGMQDPTAGVEAWDHDRVEEGW